MAWIPDLPERLLAFSAVLPLFIVVGAISPPPGDSPATVPAGKLDLAAQDVCSVRSVVARRGWNAPGSVSSAWCSLC